MHPTDVELRSFLTKVSAFVTNMSQALTCPVCSNSKKGPFVTCLGQCAQFVHEKCLVKATNEEGDIACPNCVNKGPGKATMAFLNVRLIQLSNLVLGLRNELEDARKELSEVKASVSNIAFVSDPAVLVQEPRKHQSGPPSLPQRKETASSSQPSLTNGRKKSSLSNPTRHKNKESWTVEKKKEVKTKTTADGKSAQGLQRKQKQAGKRTPEKRNVSPPMVGSGGSSLPFSTATQRPKKTRIFVSRIAAETSPSDVLRYCLSLTKNVLSVSKLKNKHADSYASFVVSVLYEESEKILDATKWGDGMLLKVFRGTPNQGQIAETAEADQLIETTDKSTVV